MEKCFHPTIPVCPVYTTLDAIGGRWKPLIIWYLLTGTKRFSELKRSIQGVTQKMLTQQLRELEQAGLVRRTVYAEVPPRVEYSLTPMGCSLRHVLEAMSAWGQRQDAAQARNATAMDQPEPAAAVSAAAKQ